MLNNLQVKKFTFYHLISWCPSWIKSWWSLKLWNLRLNTCTIFWTRPYWRIPKEIPWYLNPKKISTGSSTRSEKCPEISLYPYRAKPSINSQWTMSNKLSGSLNFTRSSLSYKHKDGRKNQTKRLTLLVLQLPTKRLITIKRRKKLKLKTYEP